MSDRPVSADLVSLLNQPGVSHPEAVHKYDCRYWRSGKSHGPCTCGARELSARIRVALVQSGIAVRESPAQIHERDSLTAIGEMCTDHIERHQGAWLCKGCGWRMVMP